MGEIGGHAVRRLTLAGLAAGVREEEVDGWLGGTGEVLGWTTTSRRRRRRMTIHRRPFWLYF